MKEEPPSGTNFGIDQDAYVLGYPLGFADDVHNLPVLRRATVASKYGVQFEGEPRFLVDARLHEGSSGSPVFARASDFYEVDTGVIDTHHKPTSYFLGIFSDEWEVDDEPLGLNSVWYASIVREIVDRN